MGITTIQELLQPTFGNFHLKPVIAFSILLCGIAICCLIAIEQFRIKQNALRIERRWLLAQPERKIKRLDEINNKLKNTRYINMLRYIVFLIVCFSGIIIFAGISLFTISSKHGCREYEKYNIKEIIYSVQHSPKEDRLPKSINDVTVIYYRFGCNDCNELYEELSERFENLSDVYWVATRSEQGKELREQYPVESVPSAIFIHDGKAVTFELYTKTTKNDTITATIDENNISELLKYRSKHLIEQE